MPIAFLFTCLLALSIWKTPPLQVAAASIDGLITAGSILYIVFGAIILLNLQRESGAISAIRRSMFLISPDRRVQAIIIAFLFGAIISLGGCAGSRCKKAKVVKKKEWEDVEAEVKAGIRSWLAESDSPEGEWEEIARKVEEKIKRELKTWAEN